MFSVHCPRHGCEVLLNHRHIRRLDGSGTTLRVHWTCWCGYEGVLHPRRARAERVLSVA